MNSSTPPLRFSLLLIAASLLAPSCLAADPDTGHWPQFRGTSARGIAEGPAPTTWDAEKGTNIKWKTPIPGLAHSSPVIWGNRLFVTSSVTDDDKPYLRVGLYGESPDHPEDVDHDYRLYCLDKGTGEVLWQKTAHRGIPKIKRHIKSTHANPTPATDGKHVVVFFGSEGLYCYDLDGSLLWKKDLGLLDSGAPQAGYGEIQWGVAGSPVIHENQVFVQCDMRNQSFIASFDINTGSELWRTKRSDTGTWSTPTVHTSDGRTQVIANGFKHIGGYDASTGEEIWKMRGGGDVPVPTPIVSHDLIFITNAHGAKAPIYAIRTSASGDITMPTSTDRSKDIAWSYFRRGNYMQTPLAYGEFFYTCRNNGSMTCYDIRTGDIHYRKRLGGGRTGFSASPVAADGKIYFTSEEGEVHVIKQGPKFELLSVNPMGEVCMATPAISQGNIYFRTQHNVVCVGQ